MSTAAAAVLARLWGACAREPLDGIAQRLTDGSDLMVVLSDGRVVRGPEAASEAFAPAPPDLALRIDGTAFTDPGEFAATLLGTHSPEARRFRDELDDSVANLALARAAQPPPTGGPDALTALRGRPEALAYLEQSVVDGHPLHPLCRTRMGMSADDGRRYAPEFRPTIDLPVVSVPPERWHTSGIGLPPRLPMHPWQRNHLLDAHPSLHFTGETIRARPLMSLRTVALADEPAWHLKTSIDVQMTSAVRIVSPAAIHNGPLVSALLATLAADEPLDVLAEVAAGAVLVDGQPSRSLAVVLRAAPTLAPDEITLPFAVLSVPSPASGRPFLCEAVGGGDPTTFFTELVALTIPPMLRLLHRGVALEAHGQNTLVVLRGSRPVRVIYRDMGGVRVSSERLAAAGIGAPPQLLGDLATDDPDALRTKLAAALLSTVVAEIIATLGREYSLAPAPLWRVVAGVIRATYRNLPADASSDEDAMLGPTLPIKATTAMRLSPRPLEDIWTPIENPMAAT